MRNFKSVINSRDHLIFFFLFPISLLIAGCSAHQGNTDDFTIPLYKPEYSQGFEILGAEGRESILIRSLQPWQGAAKGVHKDFLILKDGESASEDFDGTVINGEAERVICMSSGHIAMLSLLGETDKVVGGSNLAYVSSPEIQSRRAELKEVGFEGAIDYESMLAARPDLVILYGVNSANPMESKLKELGIPYIYIGDYLEENALGKAEWLVAIGECIGKRKDAIDHFAPIRDNYLKMKNFADSLTRNRQKPNVMLNMPYGDSWFMPPSDSYMVNLIKDAGGNYLYDKNKSNSSKSISMEEARMLLSKADVWINLGPNINNIEQLKQSVPQLADMKIFNSGKVYNNTLRSTISGGNDFYESGVVNPDLILGDLVKILYPETIDSNFTYYMQLRPELAEVEDAENF